MTANYASIPPTEAVGMYLDSKKGEHTEATLKSSRHRLNTFLQFWDQEGIEDLTTISCRDLYRY